MPRLQKCAGVQGNRTTACCVASGDRLEVTVAAPRHARLRLTLEDQDDLGVGGVGHGEVQFEAVIGIEPDADLAAKAQSLLAEVEVDNAVVNQGDPAAGDAGHGPYDVIFVNGAVEDLPQALTDQLKNGGRLVALFRQGGVGQCCVMTRAGASVSPRYVFDADAPLLAGFEKAAEFTF